MNISPISYNFSTSLINKKTTSTSDIHKDSKEVTSSITNINFASRFSTRHIIDIDEQVYKTLTETRKRFLRNKCENFSKTLDVKELANPLKPYLPLASNKDMEDFIKCCDYFKTLKGRPIICLGRSPKWFLNTSLWMKEGIGGYKFVPFSGAWYKQGLWKLERDDIKAPTEEEILAYEKYLKTIEADPVSLLRDVQKTGKKIALTDYIRTGKGVTSFLEIIGKYAQKQGVMDEFGKSIDFFGFGNLEFLEEAYYEDISIPRMQLTEEFVPYREEIGQSYYKVPYESCMQILENGNTNECRATYYPHEAWTTYNPNRYRTGKISDKALKELEITSPKIITNFTDTMRDYRNLLNFRILDYLAQNDLLR